MRQQLAVYQRKNPRPYIDPLDRMFWVVLKDHFTAWAEALIIVKPETVVAWHRKRFQFVVIQLDTRKVVHVNVTEHPSQAWVQQQIRDATFEGAPKFIMRDNDGIYGQLGQPVTREVNGKSVSCRSAFDAWLAGTMGIRGIPTPYGAPNAAAHIERFMGTLRRELLDRILVWNEGQLRAVVAEYTRWYDAGRVHQGIHGIPDPDPELAAPKPADGKLVARPVLNSFFIKRVIGKRPGGLWCGFARLTMFPTKRCAAHQT